MAYVGRVTGGNEEQASERRRVGRAVEEDRNSERSEARGVRMGRTPVAKHYRYDKHKKRFLYFKENFSVEEKSSHHWVCTRQMGMLTK